MPNSHNPRHIAIIPDGNRRWARKQGFKPWQGHEAGFKQFRPILQKALDENITYISAWMCSKDNLTKRPPEEIEVLYKVFQSLFDELGSMPEVDERKIKIQAFGEWESVQPSKLVASIKALVERTAHHDQLFLNLFDAYDGISEMTRAVAAISDEKVAHPNLEITPEVIKQHLYTRELPPVDLVIRTGGEPHWSGGFLMWDIANAQMHFSEKMWPDFTADDFMVAIEEYRTREIRKGK